MSRQQATNGSARISFEDSGSGRAIVLTHSFLCDRHMWSGQVGELSEHARVVNIDVRGHGDSSRAEPGVTLHDLVDDVVAVLDHLGIERAIWGGLSIGGMIGLRAALTVPERVEALILVNTDGGAEGWSRKLRYRAMGLAARLLGIRPLAGATAAQMFGRSTHRGRRKLIEEWRARVDVIDLPSTLALLPTITGRDSLLHRLPEIEVPCLVIGGDEDVSLPPERSRRLAAGLPDARLLIVEKAGHLSAVERPAEVTRAMLSFLQELAEPASAEA